MFEFFVKETSQSLTGFCFTLGSVESGVLVKKPKDENQAGGSNHHVRVEHFISAGVHIGLDILDEILEDQHEEIAETLFDSLINHSLEQSASDQAEKSLLEEINADLVLSLAGTHLGLFKLFSIDSLSHFYLLTPHFFTIKN